MIKKFIASVTLMVFISLALNQAIFAAADNSVSQTISVNMKGFAFTNSSCCPDVSSSMTGKLTTENGASELSQQVGSITIGSETYQLEFNPSGKITKEVEGSDCSSGTSYQQDGLISIMGSNGTAFNGSGVFSWGTFSSCSDETNPFANLSGTIQDSTGQPTEFYTGTNSLPTGQ